MNIKNKLLSRTFSVLLIVSIACLSGTIQARIKCWKSDEGVRECGEKVPPQYSQKGHETVSKQGLIIDKTQRAKTKEEREEEARLLAIQKKQEAVENERKTKDKILLDTYSNTNDIQSVADETISSIEASIKLANKRNDSIQADLDKRKQNIARLEQENRDVAPALIEDIKFLEKQIAKNTEFITKREAEKERMTQEYAEKIQRFRELKGNK